jgi:hypothetical protein
MELNVMIMASISAEYILVIHCTYPVNKDHGIIGITLIQYPSNDISQHTPSMTSVNIDMLNK